MTEDPISSKERMPPASRRQLWALVLLFVVPLAIAFLLYYGADWRPAKHTEHGDLIHPARPLPEVSLVTADGATTSPKFLAERWSLVFVGGGQCDDRCKAALADMQRAREMLGKDIVRVQSVFLSTEQCCDRQALQGLYPNLVVARLDTGEIDKFIAVFPLYNGVPLNAAGRIYIVDPLGNLMMSYPPEATGIGMYEDLKTLLKLSHIG